MSAENRANEFVTVLVAAALSIGLSPSPAFAAGTPGEDSGDLIEDGMSAGETAIAYYQQGLAHKDSAWEMETQAAAANTDGDRENYLAQAQSAYQGAVEAQGKALKLHLSYYQAANELGYALRRTGDYRKAIGAYNFALQIKPDFFQAVEYRGEAYLALGMLDKARQAYMTLFQNDPLLAAQLLTAMEQWTAAPESADEAFKAWVAERKTLAALTPTADGPGGEDW